MLPSPLHTPIHSSSELSRSCLSRSYGREVRDRIYDEKQNTVLIFVCCSPEKIQQKIICKGGKTVQSVEILPKKPKRVRFNLPPKETAKQPAPAPVPTLRQKAPKAHPQKAP